MKETHNFISDKESNSLINFHKENFNLNNSYSKKHRETEVLQCAYMPKNSLVENMYSLLDNYIKTINKDYEINYFEIVKWPQNEFQDKHKDYSFHPYTSILYLNDNFNGGETVVDDKIIKPKKCKLISFEGNQIIHGVNTITKGERYTVPCWYKNKGIKITWN
jgi:glutaredoxin-related protein